MTSQMFQPEAKWNDKPYPLTFLSDMRKAIYSAIRTISDGFERSAQDDLKNDKNIAAERKIYRFYQGIIFNSADEANDFLNDLCVSIVQNSNLNTSAAMARICAHVADSQGISASRMIIFRKIARSVLFALWSNEQILLPITVSLRAAGDNPVTRSIASPIYRFCADFASAEGSEQFRIQQHVTRWLFATAWTHAHKIDVDTAIKFNRFIYICKAGEAGFAVPKINPCVGLLLAKLREADVAGLGYTSQDVAQYDYHFAHRLPGSVDFDQIDAFKEKIANERAEKRAVIGNRKKNRTRTYVKKSLLTHDVTPGDVIIFAKDRARTGWFPDLSDCSFLQVRLSGTAIKSWESLFEHYIDYRKTKGIEALESTFNALRCLADYVGMVLPVYWSHADIHAILPESPKNFLRSKFVVVHEEAHKRYGLIPYVKRRFSSTDSQYSYLNKLWQFFEYVRVNFGDEESASIAGPEFRNPISREFDFPRTRGARSRGTNKQVFNRLVVPHFLSWLYALENFVAFASDRKLHIDPHETRIDPADFGWEPIYWHLGKSYRIGAIPQDVLRRTRGVAHIPATMLRMIIMGMETGLRLQSIQWLCKLTFNQHNVAASGNDFATLYVNTDKTKDPYSIPILKRVHDVLLRELRDQDSLGIADVPMFYERRDHTRFAPMVPLFRNSQTSEPFSDGTYSAFWVALLSAFQLHIQPIAPETFVKFKRMKDRPVVTDKNGVQYCPVRLKALYTPHSVRSTFITRRSPFITLDDIARLVGQANGAVSRHYEVAEIDALAQKLLYADNAIQSGMREPAPIAGGLAFVDARDRNSALVTAFTKDREAAINAFGMIALRPAIETEVDGVATSGLDVIRASPMSQVVFRDTHICPVGEVCPPDIVVTLRGERRCGLCPLACKTIDHLPAIVAKQRLLLERLQGSQQVYKKLRERGDQQSELAEIHDAIDADVQEFFGWRLAEEILDDILSRGVEAAGAIYTAEPEIVRRHLQRVVKTSSQQAFMLMRIVEANHYPTMATDRLHRQASKLRRRILAGVESVEDMDADDEDDIAVLAGYVTTFLKASNASFEDLAQSIQQPRAVRSRPPVLLEAASGL